MAMRLYTKAEFEAELKEKWGLTPTEQVFATFRIWRHECGGHLTVPELPRGERYPDHFLDGVIEQIERIKANPRP